MSANLVNRKHLLQRAYQCPQGMLLPLCTGICRNSPGIQSALIRYSDAVVVVPQAMCPHHIQRSGRPDESILPNVEMIAYHLHSPCPMASQQILLCKIGIHPCSGAMHHYQGNGTGYPTHAEMPNAPAIAVVTATITFKMIFHVLLFLVGSLFIVVLMSLVLFVQKIRLPVLPMFLPQSLRLRPLSSIWNRSGWPMLHSGWFPVGKGYGLG